MKPKQHGYLIGFLMLILAVPGYAQSPAALSPQPVQTAGAQASAQIGIVAAVSGKVELSRGGSVGRVVESGEAVFLGDKITTGPEGSLQIIMMDETVFTVGRNSSVVIEDFIYDPQTDDGEISARVVDGVFKFVTGKIGKKKPENMKIQLPTGIMGVRGTIGVVKANQQTGESTGILFGPGQNTNTQHRKGSIILMNTVGEGGKETVKSTLVTRTGYASTILPGQAPSDVFKVPDTLMLEIKEAVKPAAEKQDESGDSQSGDQSAKKDADPPADRQNKKPGGPGSGGDDQGPSGNKKDDGGSAPMARGRNAGTGPMADPLMMDRSATQQAGQDTASGINYSFDTFRSQDLGDHIGDDAADPTLSTTNNLLQIVDGPSYFEQLRALNMGIFSYKQTGLTLRSENGSVVGSYNIQFDINFGQKTIGGGQSKLTGSSSIIDAGDAFNFNIPTLGYGNLQGQANFFYNDLADTGGSLTGVSTADVNIQLLNGGGVVARGAAHGVHISDTADTVNGGGVAQQQSGAST